VWPGTICLPTTLQPNDGQRAVNDLGSFSSGPMNPVLRRLGYSTAITSYETLEGDSEELQEGVD